MIKVGKCVICDHVTSGSLEFCRSCYTEYKDAIKEKERWTRELKNSAQRERRKKEKERGNISLDALLDYSFTREERRKR